MNFINKRWTIDSSVLLLSYNSASTIAPIKKKKIEPAWAEKISIPIEPIPQVSLNTSSIYVSRKKQVVVHTSNLTCSILLRRLPLPLHHSQNNLFQSTDFSGSDRRSIKTSYTYAPSRPLSILLFHRPIKMGLGIFTHSRSVPLSHNFFAVAES